MKILAENFRSGLNATKHVTLSILLTCLAKLEDNLVFWLHEDCPEMRPGAAHWGSVRMAWSHCRRSRKCGRNRRLRSRSPLRRQRPAWARPDGSLASLVARSVLRADDSGRSFQVPPLGARSQVLFRGLREFCSLSFQFWISSDSPVTVICTISVHRWNRYDRALVSDVHRRSSFSWLTEFFARNQ